MLVGGLPATHRVLLCERWCLRAFCGVYGGKGTIGVLRIARGLWRTLSIFFNTLYLWIATYVSLLVISYHDLLVLFTPTS
jgi:hypothetical protein